MGIYCDTVMFYDYLEPNDPQIKQAIRKICNVI